MPKRTNSLPKLCRDKATGRALVWLNGHRVYVGRWGTKASRQKYDQLIAEWIANGRKTPTRRQPDDRPEPSVNEVMLGYWRHAEGYYRKPDGKPTSELDNIRQALRRVKRLYGHTVAAQFGPLPLEAVRESMIGEDLSRGVINNHTDRIKRCFRWAAAKGIVPASVYAGLHAVRGLQKGRSAARETEDVKPVPEAYVDAIEPYVTPQVWAMVELQRLTGCRPGEARIMRTCDLDTGGKVWTYTPESHKTAHHGRGRVISIGPKAQAVLRLWLKTELSAYLFDPREAIAQVNAKRRANRKTPMTPSHIKRKARGGRRRVGRCYTKDSYRRSIQRACATAGVPKWFPHQLRHNAATRIRKEYGIEVARAVLGHRTATVTEVYAEMDNNLTLKVMGEIG